MSTDDFSVGDRVQITSEGAIAHRKHHDDQATVASRVPNIGVAANVVKNAVFTFPEPGWQGEIVEKKGRWWGQSGSDYLVKWDVNGSQSWHLPSHLLPIKK